MLSALDPQHVLGCRRATPRAQVTSAPGVVNHTAGRLFILGEPRPIASERRRAARGGDERGKLRRARLSADIRVEIWTKLIGNLSYNPVAALGARPHGRHPRSEPLLALIRANDGRGACASPRPSRGAHPDDGRGAHRRCEAASPAPKISMHQDVEKGRPLETDAIIGAAGGARPQSGDSRRR